MSKLQLLPCLDSEEMASCRKRELDLPRDVAAALAQGEIDAARRGFYVAGTNQQVAWREAVQAACAAKVSIPPDAPLPKKRRDKFSETRVQVTNETTLGASLRFVDRGLLPLALNFANGIQPGGGFLNGARAQEESICRSTALYQTLIGDPMYDEHRQRPAPDSTDWVIYSPRVPVFRTVDGKALERPWSLSFLTCAAPYAPSIGLGRAGDLLQQRIQRVLAISEAYGHSVLVLGPWGCGAFANDPRRTAVDFRRALEHNFGGAFSEVVFAIADWSPNRKFLGPFRDVFSDRSSL